METEQNRRRSGLMASKLAKVIGLLSTGAISRLMGVLMLSAFTPVSCSRCSKGWWEKAFGKATKQERLRSFSLVVVAQIQAIRSLANTCRSRAMFASFTSVWAELYFLV